MTHEDRRILCVGKCCPDIVSVCASYPLEDTDQMSLDYYWQRGGNASNSSSVLALLGASVEFFGTMVTSPELGFLRSDFASYGVNIDNCVIHENGAYDCPVAIVILNKEKGSRTILSSLKNYAELTFKNFDETITLLNYKWIHFEGRSNTSDIHQMLEKIAHYNTTVVESKRIATSLELEKPERLGLDSLMDKADYVFVSKTFAKARGFTCKEEATKGLIHKCKPGGTLICAWGETGASASGTTRSCDQSCDSLNVTSPAFPPMEIKDTNSAGDTFNGATIMALCEGQSLKEAITFGCKVAGAKCGMMGNKGLKGKKV